jgi:hypothetical protein
MKVNGQLHPLAALPPVPIGIGGWSLPLPGIKPQSFSPQLLMGVIKKFTLIMQFLTNVMTGTSNSGGSTGHKKHHVSPDTLALLLRSHYVCFPYISYIQIL